MKSKTTLALLSAALFVFGIASNTAFAEEDHKRGEEKKEEPAKDKDEPAKEKDAPSKSDVKPYPLDTCIVSDEKLGEMGKPFVFVHEGQEIKLCCKNCRKKFDKDPASYLKKLDGKK